MRDVPCYTLYHAHIHTTLDVKKGYSSYVYIRVIMRVGHTMRDASLASTRASESQNSRSSKKSKIAKTTTQASGASAAIRTAGKKLQKLKMAATRADAWISHDTKKKKIKLPAASGAETACTVKRSDLSRTREQHQALSQPCATVVSSSTPRLASTHPSRTQNKREGRVADRDATKKSADDDEDSVVREVAQRTSRFIHGLSPTREHTFWQLRQLAQGLKSPGRAVTRPERRKRTRQEEEEEEGSEMDCSSDTGSSSNSSSEPSWITESDDDEEDEDAEGECSQRSDADDTDASDGSEAKRKSHGGARQKGGKGGGGSQGGSLFRRDDDIWSD